MRSILPILFLLFCACVSAFQLTPRLTRNVRKTLSPQMLTMNSIEDPNEVIVGTAGIAANVICGYSLYVLKTTGCGLPPGPFGLEGAAEGISYLAIVGIFAWSLITKVQTGSGLPAGKFGLLGAAEGLTFITVLGGLVIAGLNLADYGFLPGFLPNDKCFGV